MPSAELTTSEGHRGGEAREAQPTVHGVQEYASALCLTYRTETFKPVVLELEDGLNVAVRIEHEFGSIYPINVWVQPPGLEQWQDQPWVKFLTVPHFAPKGILNGEGEVIEELRGCMDLLRAYDQALREALEVQTRESISHRGQPLSEVIDTDIEKLEATLATRKADKRALAENPDAVRYEITITPHGPSYSSDRFQVSPDDSTVVEALNGAVRAYRGEHRSSRYDKVAVMAVLPNGSTYPVESYAFSAYVARLLDGELS